MQDARILRVLTGDVVVLEEAVHPLVLDLHRPLLLLQVLGLGLPACRRLRHELLDGLWVEGVGDAVEEVPLRQPLVVALCVRQVPCQVWVHLEHLRVDDLHGELWPVRHVACGHVSLLQGQLAACEDVLDVLEPGGLERRHEDAHYSKESVRGEGQRDKGSTQPRELFALTTSDLGRVRATGPWCSCTASAGA